MKLKEGRWAALASVLLAALLLLLFSRCSPMYPTNNWGETNAFFTVGRGMLVGKLPYRDFALNAGPLVFALHALAAWISPGSFLGVWLLEIAALAAALFIAWKAAVRISGRKALSMGCAALAGLLLVSGRAFVSGDTVEEFVLPFQLWALCDLLRYMGDPQRRMFLRRMLLHGALAACSGRSKCAAPLWAAWRSRCFRGWSTSAQTARLRSSSPCTSIGTGRCSWRTRARCGMR